MCSLPLKYYFPSSLPEEVIMCGHHVWSSSSEARRDQVSAYGRVSKGWDWNHDESYQHPVTTGAAVVQVVQHTAPYTVAKNLKMFGVLIDFIGADVLEKDACEQQGVEFRSSFVSFRFVQAFL
jgi:hypothetical protein